MPAFFRYLVPLLAFLALAALLFKGLGIDPKKVPSPLIGKPAPAFNLPTLKQPQQSLSNTDLEGQVSLLNVWATWCVACRQEHFATFSSRAVGQLGHGRDLAHAVYLCSWANPASLYMGSITRINGQLQNSGYNASATPISPTHLMPKAALELTGASMERRKPLS